MTIFNMVDTLAQMKNTGAVAGDDTGFVWIISEEIGQKLLFGVSVECTGGFVEHQNRAVAKDGACNRDTLCLSL